VRAGSAYDEWPQAHPARISANEPAYRSATLLLNEASFLNALTIRVYGLSALTTRTFAIRRTLADDASPSPYGVTTFLTLAHST
jgi:hypothetical protein